MRQKIMIVNGRRYIMIGKTKRNRFSNDPSYKRFLFRKEKLDRKLRKLMDKYSDITADLTYEAGI